MTEEFICSHFNNSENTITGEPLLDHGPFCQDQLLRPQGPHTQRVRERKRETSEKYRVQTDGGGEKEKETFFFHYLRFFSRFFR